MSKHKWKIYTVFPNHARFWLERQREELEALCPHDFTWCPGPWNSAMGVQLLVTGNNCEYISAAFSFTWRSQSKLINVCSPYYGLGKHDKSNKPTFWLPTQKLWPKLCWNGWTLKLHATNCWKFQSPWMQKVWSIVSINECFHTWSVQRCIPLKM